MWVTLVQKIWTGNIIIYDYGVLRIYSSLRGEDVEKFDGLRVSGYKQHRIIKLLSFFDIFAILVPVFNAYYFLWAQTKLRIIYFASLRLACYGHITTKAAPLIRTGNLNVVELHQYWVEWSPGNPECCSVLIFQHRSHCASVGWYPWHSNSLTEHQISPSVRNWLQHGLLYF